MDKEWIRRHLPERMNPEALKWAIRTQRNDLGLGGDFLFYKAVRVKTQQSYDYPFAVKTESETVWAAECCCTACGDVFQTAGGAKSLYLGELEDGSTIPMYVDIPPDAWTETAFLELHANDKTFCPRCESRVRVMHSKHIRGGRTKRLMVKTVERVGEYAAIVHWMVERTIRENGSSYNAYPKSAFVLGERGGFTKYLHAPDPLLSAWRLASNNQDNSCAIYGDWLSYNNKKQGAVVWPECPDMTGTTAEKTGLAAFVRADESDELLAYIRLWKQWKPLEALVNAGFGKVVGSTINNSVYATINNSVYAMQELDTFLDMKQRKPAKMLYMNKPMWREYQGLGLNWDRDMLKWWARYRRQGRELRPGEFEGMRKYFGGQFRNAIGLGEDLKKVERYLTKQGHRGSDVYLLVDSRNMAKVLYNRELTAEELWPRDLHHAHETLTEQTRAVKNAEAAAKYLEGFQEVKEKYGQLEWTDGDLRMILPKDNGELVNEGDVLRHCVGGFGMRHIAGKDTIFFVRHYRRQERPYYTLDIRMTEGAPYEVQLHGYGNERHGDHKQHSHKIPRKVRDFCDRWKKEVLEPWYRAEQKKRKEKTA